MQRVMAALAAFVISGCTVVDPNRHAAGLIGELPSFTSLQAGDASQTGGTPVSSGAEDLLFVLRALDQQQVQYMTAGAEIERIRSLGPLLGAGLGAAGGLLALTGTGSSGLQGGLLSGAAGTIAFSSLYADRSRQEVYRIGAEAIGCLLSAQAALRLLRPDGTGGLVAQLRAARTALATARDGATGADYSAPWSQEATDELDQAAARNIRALDSLPGAIALRLRERGRRIVIAVDREISRAAPDPMAAYRALAGGGGTGSVGTGPTLARGAAGSGNAGGISRAAVALRRLVLEADGVLGDVSPYGTTIAGSDCRLPEVPNSLRITPNDATITLSRLPTTLVFAVNGGIGNRRSALGGETQGFDARDTAAPGGGLTVTVVATAAAAGRRAELAFIDDSGLPARRVLMVAPAAETTGPAAAGQGRGVPGRGGQTELAQALPGPQRLPPPLPPPNVALTRPQIRMVTAAIGQPVDATTNTLSEATINALVETHGVAPGDAAAGRLSLRLLRSLADTRRDAVATLPTTTFERGLFADGQLAQLSCGLMGVPPTQAERAEPGLLITPAFRRGVFETQFRFAGETRESFQLDPTGTLDLNSVRRINSEAVRAGRCPPRPG